MKEARLCTEACHTIIDKNIGIEEYEYVDIYYVYENKTMKLYGKLETKDHDEIIAKNFSLIRTISSKDIGFAEGDLAGITITFMTNLYNGHITDILELKIDIEYVINREFIELFAKYFCKNIKCEDLFKRLKNKYKNQIDNLKLSLNRNKINYNTNVISNIYDYL